MQLRRTFVPAALVVMALLANPTAADSDAGFRLDIDAGIAAERLHGIDATAFGPAVDARLQLDPGVYVGGRVARFDYRSDGAGDGLRSTLGRLEAGGVTAITRRVELVAGVEVAYRDANWRPTRWDYGVSGGLRGSAGALESEVRGLYRYPDDAADDPQVGVRLAFAGYDEQRRYGVVLSGDWLTDERHAVLALRRHF